MGPKSDKIFGTSYGSEYEAIMADTWEEDEEENDYYEEDEYDHDDYDDGFDD